MKKASEIICPNCGAVYSGSKCEYCGTVFEEEPCAPSVAKREGPVMVAEPDLFEQEENMFDAYGMARYLICFNQKIGNDDVSFTYWVDRRATDLDDILLRVSGYVPTSIKYTTKQGPKEITYFDMASYSVIRDFCENPPLDAWIDDYKLDVYELSALETYFRGLVEAVEGNGRYIDELAKEIERHEAAQSKAQMKSKVNNIISVVVGLMISAVFLTLLLKICF